MFLVYISSKQEYALELFQNQPFDFLIKPIKKERLYHTMDKIFSIIGCEKVPKIYEKNFVLESLNFAKKIKLLRKGDTKLALHY